MNSEAIAQIKQKIRELDDDIYYLKGLPDSHIHETIAGNATNREQMNFVIGYRNALEWILGLDAQAKSKPVWESFTQPIPCIDSGFNE